MIVRLTPRKLYCLLTVVANDDNKAIINTMERLETLGELRKVL